MIRKTVYFRTQEDFDKFNAIGNKAEWLHNMLNKDKPNIYSDKIVNKIFDNSLQQRIIMTGEPTYTEPENTA